jgi:hypothetical protein
MAGSAGKDNTVAAKIRNRKMEDGNSKVERQGASLPEHLRRLRLLEK